MRRIVALLLILVLIVAVHGSGITHYVTLDQLKNNSEYLQQMVAEHYGYSVLAFILFYTLFVAFLLPMALLLTITSGFLFGTMWGTLYTNIGVTLGSTIAFLTVRYVIGNALQRRYHDRLVRFNHAIEREGVVYLIIVHLIAVVPLGLVNLLAGLTRIPLWTFVWTTSLGIVPCSLIYAFAGRQLATVHSLTDLFSAHVIGAFMLLAVLACVPIIIRHMRRQFNV